MVATARPLLAQSGIAVSRKESRVAPSGRASRDPATTPGLRASFGIYFANTGSGGTLSLGAPACMVISVIDVMS
jgi:hypothetical protein